MGRNKLIYGLADWACVVSADTRKGGTWAGAEEELRRQPHVPVFVRIEEDPPPGNQMLLEIGALPFPASPWPTPLSDVLASAGRVSQASSNRFRQRTLFDSQGHDPGIAQS